MAKKTDHSNAKWNIFFYHALLFLGVHLLFVPIFGVLPLSELGSESYLEYIVDHFVNQGVPIYQNSTVNMISSIWKTVLIVHLILEIIETFFPSKRKDSQTEGQTKEEEREAEEGKREKKLEEKNSLGRAWIYLMIAGLLEIIWATALKMDMLSGPIIIVLIVSFDLLIKSVKRLGVGTAYAVFTGIGVVGMVIVDIVLFQEAISFLKMLLVVLLVIFIIGLRFSSEGQGDLR